MRILLTGHRGYIGAVLGPLLQSAGHEVVGLDSDLFSGCDFPADVAPKEMESLEVDLRDVAGKHLQGFDAVVHLAGLSNDPLGDLDPGLTEAINTEASLHLARLARAVGVRRFVFSSSCSTYGAASPDDVLDETASFNPVTPYGVSKVDVEAGLGALANDDFSPTYLRNATVYGVSPRLRLDLVLNNLVAWAVTTGKVVLLSDGTPWRPLVHVGDVAAAARAVLEAPREAVHGEAFNVGRNEENYRIRDLAEIVADTVPGAEIEIAPGAGPDARCYRVRCDKIERMLPDFRPSWDARKGARELFEAYRGAGLTLEDLQGPRYKRLGWVRRQIDRGVLSTDLRRLAVGVRN